MAGSSYTLSYNLTGEGQVVRGIRNMDSATRRLRKSTGGLSGGMKGLASRFVGVQMAANYALQKGRELIKWVQESIKAFREFETRIAEVGTILQGLGMRQLPALSAGIETLSVKFGKSANDLAKGMYDILSAAFNARDSMSLLTVATRASIAGLSSVETSVDALTSVLNAYGKSAYQATQISDIMFQTVIRGKLRYEDLAASMGYIAPIAANLGVEFEEVAAALTTVTRQGQHVDMATRGLALGLQNIADITPKAAAAAAKYNVNLSATALRVGGLEYIIQELNTAMKEHGTKILPQMITNMRSLRVFMALAGEEGIGGFTQDLNLMKTAAGKTEEAMSKMMITTQRQAEMLDMSFQKLERDVGKAWSGTDIWWKKTKLWWGTVFSGGDADEAVAQHLEFVSRLEDNYAKLVLGMNNAGEASDDFYSTLMRNEREPLLLSKFPDIVKNILKPLVPIISKMNIGKVIDETIDWGRANAYLSETFEQQDLLERYEEINKFGTGLRQTFKGNTEEMLAFSEALDIPYEKIVKLSNIMSKESIKKGDAAWVAGFFKEFSDINIDEFFKEDKTWGRLNRKDTFDWEGIFGTLDVGQVGGAVGQALTDVHDEIELSGGIIDQYSDAWNELVGGFDALVEGIQNTEMNILELNYTLADLDVQLHDVYSTLGGHEFEGTMRWELAVSAAGTALDRFQHYSQMAIKYGDDMETGYMDGLQSIIDASDIDYDVSTFYPDTLDEYGMSMEDVISTMSNYIEVKEEMTEAEKEYNDIIKEINKENMKLSLDYLKIQIKGMMRRRGNTRSELKQMKQIEIEKTENRIEQMEAQLDYQEEYDEKMTDEMQDAYDKASKIYEEYVDRTKLYLWELKDARDDELANFITNISRQEQYFDLYTGWLSDAEDHLGYLSLAINKLAYDIDENIPEWEEFFNTTAMDMAASALESVNEQILAIINNTGGTPSSGGSSGGSQTPFEEASETFLPPGTSGTPIGDIIRGLLPSPPASRGFPWASRGTHNVPKTQPYILHRGEQVIPSGSDNHSNGNISVTIINNNAINNNMDAENVSRMMAEAVITRLSNEEGQSRYRFR